MVKLSQSTSVTTDELLGIIEDCLNNYASDVHLFQSPLTTWEVVRCRLSAGMVSGPEQLALAVRSVLDDLIDALWSSDNYDLNSPSVRRYIIADHLYRRGLKQTEICRSCLPLSKSQFYRERTETLVALTNYLQLWEQLAIERRKSKAIRTLTMFSPMSDTRLVGADSVLQQLVSSLTSADGPKLTMLSGVGGVGKTAVTQAAVECVLNDNHFHALVWVNCQWEKVIGGNVPESDVSALKLDTFYNQVLLQLQPNMVSERCLFEQFSIQQDQERVTFDHVLSFLGEEFDRQDPDPLPLSEKRPLAMEMLSAVPTLIVIDGLEAVARVHPILEELWRIASRTNVRILITTRTRFSDCVHTRYISMSALDEASTIELLKLHAAQRGIDAVGSASAEELSSLACASGGNPLVIQWLVNQLVALPIPEVLLELAQASGSTSELYNFIYRQAWESLSAPARHMLVTIAQSPGLRITWDALQHAAHLGADVLRRSLQELVASSLLEMTASSIPSYHILPTTSAFALAAFSSARKGSQAIRTFQEAVVKETNVAAAKG